MNRRYIISLSALMALGFALLPSTAISKQSNDHSPQILRVLSGSDPSGPI